MPLPRHIQMEIDLSAAAHQREIAEGFAKLRAKLLPEPKPDPQAEMMRALLNGALHWNAQQTRDMQPGNGPMINPLQAQNAAWQCNGGANIYAGWMGLGTPWFR